MEGTLQSGPPLDLYFASLRFLDWWIDYEGWIERGATMGWREQNFKALAKLPASSAALAPVDAVRWLQRYRHSPAQASRIRDIMRSKRRGGGPETCRPV